MYVEPIVHPVAAFGVINDINDNNNSSVAECWLYDITQQISLNIT